MDVELSDRLAALSHPHRMRVFRLLMRRCPDALPAGEIARVLNLKPSTTSVYLSALMQAGLISQERQGTSLRYEVNLEAARGVISDLFLECCNGRPDLCPPVPVPCTDMAPAPADRKMNVLFVCTGNSARSILAEAILRHEAGKRFNAYSAGAHPREAVHPFALELAKECGIDTSLLRSKPLSDYQGPQAPPFDFVFTVCDFAANEERSPWPGQPISAHWGLPDPAQANGTPAEKRLAFQQVFGALSNRIRAFAALPFSTTNRVDLQRHVDEIGRTPEIV